MVKMGIWVIGIKMILVVMLLSGGSEGLSLLGAYKGDKMKGLGHWTTCQRRTP